VRDRVEWKGSDLGGDMVIARAAEDSNSKFGQPLYNLAVVVDDIEMQITHVIRGEDHIANTAKQILLYEAMGAKVPEFAHTPLILSISGKKLSKRDGVTSIDDFKKMGFLPEAMVNYMSLLGWTPPDSTQEIFTLEEAAKLFSLDRVNKAGAKFDWEKLDWINSQYLHQMPVPKLVELLIPYWQEAGYQVDLEKERAWLETLTAVIAPSLTRLTDAVKESHLLFGESVEYGEEAIAFMKQEGISEILKSIIEAIPTQLTEADAKGILKQVTKTHNVKQGLVMRSLRGALTGEMHGPDLVQSWLLLHQKDLDKTRLQQALSNL
jgi:glutamyl-tRNA synthetase